MARAGRPRLASLAQKARLVLMTQGALVTRLAPAVPACILLALSAAPAGAGVNGVFYRELNLLAGYSDENQWIGEGPGGIKNSIGFEYFAKVSNDYGDYLTWNLQARLGYHTRLPSGDRWGLEIHSAWVEYKLGLGSNVRAGHFAPAFGLEPNVDTHATLFQTLAIQDIGFKKDWGLEYRGGLSVFDYSVALQLGSGMTIDRKDGSYLATGRIGTPPGRDLEWGLSLLVGDVLRSVPMRTIPRPEVSDEAVTRRRAGADARYRRGSFLLMAEATAGWNQAAGDGEKRDVAGILFQTDYTVPSLHALTAQFQGRFWTEKAGDADRTTATLSLGGSYDIRSSWALRAVVFHDLEMPDSREDTRIYIQLYYFGA
jgi:hypothetical protein